MIDKDIPFSKEQYYKLFLNLCESENLKENLPELEKLLQRIMGFEVRLEYVRHTVDSSPFQSLGNGLLGHTFGLQGNTICEFEDIAATMIATQNMDFKTIKKNMTVIELILEYFVFSNRNIILKFQSNKAPTIVLGENYLGYNTILTAS